MKIVAIFEIVNESLLVVKFDNKSVDEFTHLMDYLSDTQYLRTFFKQNEKYLNGGYYKNITVNEAVVRTIEEAETLEQLIKETAENGKQNVKESLQTIFKPLKNKESFGKPLQQSKMYGPHLKSWIRVYGIRVGPNLYVITGGGIKLTDDMSGKLLQEELLKLELTKEYLKKKEILDENDYEFFEF